MNYFASEPLNDTDSDVVIYYPLLLRQFIPEMTTLRKNVPAS